ncbi:MAG: DUF4347 domain-containing protein [Acidobacteriota bacterium]|nr:DUF4347 domain-containing protein [Acidobacteriota bacterium]
MKIDVVDMDDPILGTHRRNLAQSSGSTVIEMYGMSNGISQMVSNTRQAASLHSIEVLRIWGHGWSGGQLISAGHDSQIGVDHGSALWANNLPQFQATLSQLRNYFVSNGRVELKGCQVASGNAGEEFLKALASIFGVNVIGAVETQGGAWVAGQHWNGPLVQATPNGGLSSVMGQSL